MDCSSASKSTGGNVQVCMSFANIAAEDESIDVKIIANHDLIPLLTHKALTKVVARCFRPAQSVVSYLRWVITVYKQIKIHRPDVLFVPYGPIYWNFYIPTLQGFAEPWEPKSNPLYLKKCSNNEKLRSNLRKKIQIFFYRKSDFLWCETQNAIEYFCKISGYPISKTKVIPNSVPQIFDAINIKASDYFHNTERRFKFLYVAAPYKHKNHDLILDIIDKLGDKYEFHLTLPENHIYKNYFFNIFKSKNTQTKIVNHGYVKVNELPKLYEICDAIFMPSIAEVFSASYLEAMLCKRPVLASDLPFAKEVLADAALYFNPESIDSVIHKIKEISCNKEIYDNLVKKGQNRLLEYLTPKEKYNETINYLKSLLNK